MWPFSRKTKKPPALTLRDGLDHLSAIGIHMRPTIQLDDLLNSTGGSLASPIEPVILLCILGGEQVNGNFEPISDDIWHFDAECIDDDGSYVALAERFMVLAKGALPLERLEDHVDIEEGKAWFAFDISGKRTKWNLEVNNDWVDPEFYLKMQSLVKSVTPDKGFFIAALGQDSLIGYGDQKLKDAVGQFAGIKFVWE